MCVCCSMNSQVKGGTTRLERHTYIHRQIHTHQLEGYFPWAEGFHGVGSCLSCLICLRAFWLFLARPPSTQLKKTHSCTHVASDLVTYLVLLLGLFHGLEKAVVSTEGYVCKPCYLVLSSLTVAGTSCLSNDHTLACDWLVWCERGEEKLLV